MFNRLFESFKNDKLFENEDSGSGGGDLGDMTDLDILNNDEESNSDSDDNSSDDSSDDNVDDSDDSSDNDDNSDAGADADDSDDDDSSNDNDDSDDDDTLDADATPAEKTTFANVKAKYPNIFKEFPGLKEAFGTARSYQNEFATVQEARDAREQLEGYQSLADSLAIGSPVELMSQLKENEAAFVTFSKKFLPALHKLDQNTFYEVTQPILVTALKNAFKSANGKTDAYNKNLLTAVKYLSHFYFEEQNPENIQTTNPNRNDVDPEKVRLQKERDDFLVARGREYLVDINTTVKTELHKLIGAQLKDSLKGRKDISAYTLTKLKDDIFNHIDSEINKDTNFIRGIRSLMLKAQKTGYSDKATLSRIKSSFLERGKTRVASSAKLMLKQAKLIKSNQGVKNDNLQGNRGTGNRSQNNNNTGNTNLKKPIDYSKTSDLDILSGKF